MTRLTLALAAASALALPAAVPAAPEATPLKGTVGPGFTITLKTAAGRNVTTLAPGSYRIRVADRSDIHDFHLRGPGMNRIITGVAFRGTKTVTVRLRPGRYTYVCDPHPTSMKRSFRVRPA
jgi:plastocyanin